MAKFWSEAEDARLCELYPIGGVQAVLAELPHRNKAGVIQRANAKGVRSGVTRNRDSQGWNGEWVAPVQDHAQAHRLWQRCDVAMGGERRLAA